MFTSDTSGEAASSSAPPSAEAVLALLVEAEKSLGATPWNDVFHLCELLRDTAERFAPATAAFYLCRYDPVESGVLNFVYNYDSGRYDEPESFTLGAGPTSHVIRTGAPLRFRGGEDAEEEGKEDEAARRTHQNTTYFGDLNRTSRAALHFPLWGRTGADNAGEDPRRIIGVLSAQSYDLNAYDSAVCRSALEWLADRAGAILAEWDVRNQAERSCREAEARVLAADARTGVRLQEIARHFGQTLAALSREADAIQALVPPNLVDLRRAVNDLRRACSRAMTETSQIGAPSPSSSRNAAAGTTGSPPATKPRTPNGKGEDAPLSRATSKTLSPDILNVLSEREREIALLVAEGLPYRVIAARLFVSTNTIKHHLVAMRRKLGVSNRHEIAYRIMEARRDATKGLH